MVGEQSIFYLSVCLLDLKLLSMETYVVCSRCWGCPLPLLVFPGFPTQVHSPWFPIVKTASLCLGASGSCWSLLCCQNSRWNVRGMGLPGATSNQRLMGVGTEVPQVLHPGLFTLSYPNRGSLPSSTWLTRLMTSFIGSMPFLVLLPLPFLSTKYTCISMLVSASASGRIQTKMVHKLHLRACPKSTNVRGWAWCDHFVSLILTPLFSQMNEVVMIPIWKGFEHESHLSKDIRQ